MRWKGCLGIGALLLIGILIATVAFGSLGGDDSSTLETVAVERGNLTISVSGSGTVAAEHTLDLPFQTSGRVETVLVAEGDEVQTGQMLARLETRELKLALADAEANLEAAQASLEQAQKGNATPYDLESARASVDQSAAQLRQQVNGNATTGDIASAQANLRSAQAQLGQQLTNSEAEIADAASRLRVAQSNLDDLLAGPKPEDLSVAQRNYDQALAQYNGEVVNLQETRDRLSLEKTQAQQAMEQAAISVQTAQSEYSTAYWRYQGVRDDGTVPETTEMASLNPDTLTDYGQLTEAEAFRQAQLKLQDAETALEKAQVAFENAQQAEITGVQQAEQSLTSAEATLRDAQVQLEVEQAGATEAERIEAQEAVEQARIELERLQNSRDAEIVQSQAAVDQAAANLLQLQEGGSEAEIAAAQASLEQAQAQYEELTAPATETDLRIEQTAVRQAENDLERARIDLEHAELVAPFAGVVTAVDIVPGSVMGESTTAISLIDRDPLHVDLTLNENDVTQAAIGQKVALSISALPDWEATGTVTYVAPVSEADSEVVTYRVRVSFPDTDERVKVGMTADLEIITSSVDQALLVPNTALVPDGNDQTVLVVDPQSQLSRAVVVKVGLTDGTRTQIVSGLEEGQQIVAQPTLADGTSTNRGFFAVPSGPPPGGGSNRMRSLW